MTIEPQSGLFEINAEDCNAQLHLVDPDKEIYFSDVFISNLVMAGNLATTSAHRNKIQIRLLKTIERSGMFDIEMLDLDHVVDHSFYNGIHARYRNGQSAFKLYFQPLDKYNRFCKLEFNPHIAGYEGIKAIQHWIDDQFYQGAFQRLLLAKNCIKKIDISVDIVSPFALADYVVFLKSKKPFMKKYSASGEPVGVYQCRKDGSQERWIETIDTSAYSETPQTFNTMRFTRQSRKPNKNMREFVSNDRHPFAGIRVYKLENSQFTDTVNSRGRFKSDDYGENILDSRNLNDPWRNMFDEFVGV